MIQVICKR